MEVGGVGSVSTDLDWLWLPLPNNRSITSWIFRFSSWYPDLVSVVVEASVLTVEEGSGALIAGVIAGVVGTSSSSPLRVTRSFPISSTAVP